ncbi:MAG TPA: PqqD family protein [Novosphingobium sp.]
MTAVTRNEGNFVETDIDEETVLMRLSDGDFFSLEGTGRAIWQAIDGTRNREGIVALLADRFDSPTEAIDADVGRFLDDLAGAGLVTFS